MNNTRRKHSLTSLVIILCCFAAAFAQQNSTSPVAQEADAYFKKQDWANAVKAYQAVTAQQPANGQAWSQLGLSFHQLGKYGEAIEAYRKAEEMGHNAIVMYNLACAYSKMNRKDEAFEWLGKSLDAKFPQPGLIAADADLANLREDARYKEIAARVDRLLRPCAHDPLYRQFDFWVGEWDVKLTANVSGPSIGSSRIELIEDGCLILENWTAARGGTGKSFNFYDRSQGKWRQVWVGNTGGALDFAGEYKDNQMRYEGQTIGPNGQKSLHRLTFFNLGPDRVRQFWETSTDGGKTWMVAFDGTYIRKK